MTGLEHYAEAAKCLEAADRATSGMATAAGAEYLHREAQVHATLYAGAQLETIARLLCEIHPDQPPSHVVQAVTDIFPGGTQ